MHVQANLLDGVRDVGARDHEVLECASEAPEVGDIRDEGALGC